MKKVIIILVLLVSTVSGFSQTDDFFNNWGPADASTTSTTDFPDLPTHDTPLGEGLLILTALGLMYERKRKGERI